MVEGLRDENGHRFRKFFGSRDTARTWLANHKEISLVEGRSGLEFTSAQRADARNALDTLADFPEATLTAAAKHYAEYLRRSEHTLPVVSLVEQFIHAKESDGRSKRYLEDLRYRLGKFARDFSDTPAATISTSDIDDWLHGLDLSAQSRMNQRRVLHTLFEFACARNVARENPVAKAGKPKITTKEPGILKPAQLKRLLEVADPKIRPMIAISAFAGLRPAEVQRLDWESVDLKHEVIAVTASSSKTASRRLVTISPNLARWLMRSRGRSGPVAPAGARRLFEKARRDARIRTWPHDALRHSWVSYRLALTGDAAKVASEAGHQESVLHRHYKQLVTSAEAERWFAIAPSDSPHTSAIFPLAAGEG